MPVMTVRGPVEAEAIGATLSHEHLLLDLRCLFEPPPPARAHLADAAPTLENLGALWRDPYHSRANLLLDDPALAARELSRFREAGGSAVIDMTTVGIGPRPGDLKIIAERSGVHVIAGAGYYRAKCLDADTLAKSAEQIEADFLEWLQSGLPGTDVTPGILGELGTSDPIHPFEERQLVAAARVQRQVGIAINVHPHIFGHRHLDILDVLERAGADLSRVVLSHCDELCEPEWHRRIAERGAVLSFDTFGSEFYFDGDGTQEPRDTDRVDCLLRLLERGRERQVVLSHDTCLKMQLREWGGYGYAHVLQHIVPRLSRRGVSSDALRTMLTDTPRRLLDVGA